MLSADHVGLPLSLERGMPDAIPRNFSMGR
jgi:hypothetical protein